MIKIYRAYASDSDFGVGAGEGVGYDLRDAGFAIRPEFVLEGREFKGAHVHVRLVRHDGSRESNREHDPRQVGRRSQGDASLCAGVVATCRSRRRHHGWAVKSLISHIRVRRHRCITGNRGTPQGVPSRSSDPFSHFQTPIDMAAAAAFTLRDNDTLRRKFEKEGFMFDQVIDKEGMVCQQMLGCNVIDPKIYDACLTHGSIARGGDSVYWRGWAAGDVPAAVADFIRFHEKCIALGLPGEPHAVAIKAWNAFRDTPCYTCLVAYQERRRILYFRERRDDCVKTLAQYEARFPVTAALLDAEAKAATVAKTAPAPIPAPVKSRAKRARKGK